MSTHLEPFSLAAYLRVASIAVAIYDFLQTLPASWRFYKQWNERRFMVSSVLFFLIQFTSIIVITISNVGFFASNFSYATCRRFHIIPPLFKVLQALVSQTIIGVRVFNLSRRSRITGAFIVVLFLVCSTAEGFTTLYSRTPFVDQDHRNCRATSLSGAFSPWTNYAVAIVYDLITTAISIFFIMKYKMASNSGVLSQLTKMMLYDGLGYFLVLTSANIVNAFMFRAQDDIRTAASSLGYCLTWIMSQRLLIHLHDASLERRNESINQAVTFTQNITSHRDVSRAIRTQFETKGGFAENLDLTVPDFDLESLDGRRSPEQLDVQVRIEKTVKLERKQRGYELENYSRTQNMSRTGYNQ